MKYIRLDEFKGMSDVCFIFPKVVGHDEFVHSMGKTSDDVVSAGFVHIGKTENGNPALHPYGKSVGLGKEMHEDDHKHLYYMVYNTFNLEEY